ncbi:MAG: hypothetical protein CMI58_03935 [Parcubacteria group bacterium]|jgi:hypothetical protein|nr:hypothetical protein [Parcubacteria group bacterium]|tara:strand:+ start:292 stop:513 length:222 start_codon:yes stop_codon:yes gene_type:complete
MDEPWRCPECNTLLNPSTVSDALIGSQRCYRCDLEAHLPVDVRRDIIEGFIENSDCYFLQLESNSVRTTSRKV